MSEYYQMRVPTLPTKRLNKQRVLLKPYGHHKNNVYSPSLQVAATNVSAKLKPNLQ